MSRHWLFLSIGIGIVTGLAFAAYPVWDLHVAQCFFDAETAGFPVTEDSDWRILRRVANLIPVLFVAPACVALLRKLILPWKPILVAPSVALFLIFSYLTGPGLITHMVFKDHWGRPRPHQIEQLGGKEKFEPWWRPNGACARNCSFVSGEASHAFWLVAPASLAPPQVRPLALGAAVLFGTAVGTLRVVFGRHFLTDVVFAGLVTIVIVYLFHWLLLGRRRNDAKLEAALERMFLRLHRLAGNALAGWGGMLTRSGTALRKAGQHLRGGTARL